LICSVIVRFSVDATEAAVAATSAVTLVGVDAPFAIDDPSLS
jgi:hypothetical protein